mgnify:FL=1
MMGGIIVGSKWYMHELRVRYQETDQMGVVYHANYLNWFEIGRTEMIRTMGITYLELESRGLLLPLTDVEMKFRLPALYDNWISIYTRITDYSTVRCQFESQIRRRSIVDVQPERILEPGLALESETEPKQSIEPNGELLVSGVTKHVWLNRSWKAVRIDKESPDLYKIIKGG